MNLLIIIYLYVKKIVVIMDIIQIQRKLYSKITLHKRIWMVKKKKEDIRIFGDIFVRNNEKNCKIII